MDWLLITALFAGGLVSGGLSAVAGGSSFLTFPLLLASGLNPLVANVTNFMALTPSNFVALAAYRDELHEIRHDMALHLGIALTGGTIGSLLLVWGGEARFERFVPWLMLTATVLFAAGGWIRGRLDRLGRAGGGIRQRWLYAFEFALMIYGGYFGAGIGIIALAALAIAGQTSLHHANAQKNAMIAAMSVTGLAIYVWSGHIAWLAGLPLLAGVIVGGYASIRFIKRIPERIVRLGVFGWAVLLTIYTFWRYG
jgi:uncharacterized membrane protein YfcA